MTNPIHELNDPPVFRIDIFECPPKALDAFAERLKDIHSVLASQPGCLYNKVTVARGDTTCRVVTIVEWRDESAVAAAKSHASAHYARTGFNPAAFMAEMGITGNFGSYNPLVSMD